MNDKPWTGPHYPEWDQAQAELHAAGMTDGFPVVPPTSERIDHMLATNGCRRDEVLGVFPPTFSEVTWEAVAINAVMAGCRPDYLPVVGAVISAIAQDKFNLLGIATTTGSVAILILVNGPIADRIGVNAGAGCLGPGCQANATIGRAVNLVIRNVGGAVPGQTDMSTLGQPAKFSFCFAENEAQSPWEPLHVERGFPHDKSVVTAIGVSGIIEIVDTCSDNPEDLAQTYAQSMLIAGNVSLAAVLGSGESVIVMPPEHASVFNKRGYNKSDVKKEIFERAVLPLDRISARVRSQIEKTTDMPVLRPARQSGDLMVIVAGGVGLKAAYMPSWAGTTRSVTRAI